MQQAGSRQNRAAALFPLTDSVSAGAVSAAGFVSGVTVGSPILVGQQPGEKFHRDDWWAGHGQPTIIHHQPESTAQTGAAVSRQQCLLLYAVRSRSQSHGQLNLFAAT